MQAVGPLFGPYLDDKTFAGIVVGLALAAPPELDLEPLEVSLVLDNFDEDLQNTSSLITAIQGCPDPVGTGKRAGELRAPVALFQGLTILVDSASRWLGIHEI